MSDDQVELPATIRRWFDLAEVPYEGQVDSIKARRKELPDGKLFFDRLLAYGGVDGAC